MRTIERVLLAIAAVFCGALDVAAADSLYVCRNGVYESKPVEVGVEIDLDKDVEADSIVFTRPGHVALIDISGISAEKVVKRVFLKSNGDQKLVTNSAMKNYAASSSTSSDVMVIDVKEGETQLCVPLSFTINLAQGISITLQCEDDAYFTQSFPAAIKRVQPEFVHRFAFSDLDSLRRGNWMATIPSKVKMNMLTLAGSHDAATSKVSTSAAKCQSLTIAQQLEAGVRAFDLRPRYKSKNVEDIALENLEIYHGIVATGVKWKDALDDIVRFLDANPTEAVVVNMQKEESSGDDCSAEWRKSIRTSLQNNKQYVLQQFTVNTTLGDCRGKMVVISHNPYGSEGVYNDIVYGALTASWGDNASFTTQLNGAGGNKICDAVVSDNYKATKDADKQAFVTGNLVAANGNRTSAWFFTFMNVAWQLFGSNPDAYAKRHNAFYANVLEENAYDSRLGVVFFDFCGSADASGDKLLKALIRQNHRYLF